MSSEEKLQIEKNANSQAVKIQWPVHLDTYIFLNVYETFSKKKKDFNFLTFASKANKKIRCSYFLNTIYHVAFLLLIYYL